MSEISQLEEAILALEQQRSVLSDAVVDVALAPMREKLAALRAQVGESRFPGTRQRKQVTVLFADISGFTALAREMDAEDVTELMNAVWQRLDAIILDLGGVIDKHMGDGVMALWGVNSGREDEPERAVRAALHMQDALRTFRDERELDLAMRVGVHTGPALLGAIGITAEFTAMGTTVNLASRLEGIAPVDGVLISYETYQRVRGHFDIRPLPPVWVKGSSVLLDVYQVLRIRPRVFHPSTRGVEGVETRMVGRQVEFERLRRAFKDVIEAGAFRVVTIVGEAGIGKSRLLAEFDDWAT
ncbi:MAG: AAA family ATPase, partial [Anaerolineae bacterium]|nr:AAA family ATPase [Anaerolineae bacterium]